MVANDNILNKVLPLQNSKITPKTHLVYLH